MTREYCPDLYDAFCWHEDQKERELARYPVCSECDNPITEDVCYQINGELICIDCMRDNYLIETPIED
jgi:formylmethanofuran dehydrogenase subunit E